MVEFQKRGLPYAHVHLTLDAADKIYSARHVDATYCAKIPNKGANLELYDIVVNNIIYRPYSEQYNPNAPCMQHGKCSKRFPKSFCEETIREEGKYPMYCCRDDGREALKPCKRQGAPIALNNCWVVPYNPYLSKEI